MIIVDSPAWTNSFDLAADSMRKSKQILPTATISIKGTTRECEL